MNKLEQELIALGSALDVPAPPDLLTAIRGRLAPRPRRLGRLRPVHSRRQLALAITLAALLAGTAAAVPPVRHAVERLFGLNGAAVERVPRLPPLPKNTRGNLDLGRRIAIA